MDPLEVEDIELRLLLDGVFLRYGYDFRQYSLAHLKRRLQHRMGLWNLKHLSQLLDRLLHDETALEAVLADLSINVTEMFRDPSFFRSIRESVVPMLFTYPSVRAWHAGCASGEEVYSMAILLEEEGLYPRTQIYATDFNVEVLKRAREGIYRVEGMREYTANYQRSGGKADFSDYYTAMYDAVRFRPSLRNHVVFHEHNLATDGVFGEMHLVVCRNVMIYFNRELQNRVTRLFCDSLLPGGFLCLGSKESLSFLDVADEFEEFVPKEKIYRKRRSGLPKTGGRT